MKKSELFDMIIDERLGAPAMGVIDVYEDGKVPECWQICKAPKLDAGKYLYVRSDEFDDVQYESFVNYALSKGAHELTSTIEDKQLAEEFPGLPTWFYLFKIEED